MRLVVTLTNAYYICSSDRYEGATFQAIQEQDPNIPEKHIVIRNVRKKH